MSYFGGYPRNYQAATLPSGKRSFKVVAVNGKSHESGRYESSTPQGAARKAFTQLCRGKKGDCKLSFSVQETTQKSGHKLHAYNGHRRKLRTPKRVTRADGTVTVYKYETVVHSAKGRSASKRSRSRSRSRNRSSRRRR